MNLRGCSALAILCITISLPAASASAIEPGRAEGSFKIGKRTLKPKFAWAKQGENATEVLLSDVPLSLKALDYPPEKWTQLGAQVVRLQVVEGGSLFLASGDETLMTGSEKPGSFTWTPAAGSDGRVEGRAFSKKGLKHTWNFDVKFSAAAGEQERWGANPAATSEMAAWTSSLQDGKAKGTFIVGSKSLTLTHAYAKGKRASEGKQDVVLFLLDRAVDEPQLQNETLAEEVNGLQMKLTADGEIREIKWLHPDLNAQDFGFDLGFFEPVVVEKDHIEGRVLSLKNAAYRDTRYSYSVDFKAPIEKYGKADEFKIDSTNGKRLPKGGGEPGKAYVAYDKALRSGNIEKILAAMGADAKKQLDELTGGDREKAKDMIEMINALRASKVKVVDGYSDGERASLYVEGESSMEKGAKEKGRVNLLRDEKRWVVLKEMWGDID